MGKGQGASLFVVVRFLAAALIGRVQVHEARGVFIVSGDKSGWLLPGGVFESYISCWQINVYNKLYISFAYLEPVCPRFWGLNPPKEGPLSIQNRVIWVPGICVYIFFYTRHMWWLIVTDDTEWS